MTPDEYFTWAEGKNNEERNEKLANSLIDLGYPDNDIAYVVSDSYSRGLTKAERGQFAEEIRKRVLGLRWRRR